MFIKNVLILSSLFSFSAAASTSWICTWNKAASTPRAENAPYSMAPTGILLNVSGHHAVISQGEKVSTAYRGNDENSTVAVLDYSEASWEILIQPKNISQAKFFFSEAIAQGQGLSPGETTSFNIIYQFESNETLKDAFICSER